MASRELAAVARLEQTATPGCDRVPTVGVLQLLGRLVIGCPRRGAGSYHMQPTCCKGVNGSSYSPARARADSLPAWERSQSSQQGAVLLVEYRPFVCYALLALTTLYIALVCRVFLVRDWRTVILCRTCPVGYAARPELPDNDKDY